MAVIEEREYCYTCGSYRHHRITLSSNNNYELAIFSVVDGLCQQCGTINKKDTLEYKLDKMGL